MWLMTKYGFYSIVQKEPDVYHVRSRELQDINNLVQKIPLPDANISESDVADYAVRILVGQNDLLKILAFLGNSLDYPNFKNEVGLHSDQSCKPYHDVWGLLADSLGSYGQPGEAPKF